MSVSLRASSPSIVAPAPGLELPGGVAVWVFMVLELITFAMFLLGHAWSWHADPTGFAEAQALVHQGAGAINTAVLLIASWAAARAVHANRTPDNGGAVSRWWLVAGALGVVFTVLKIVEYTDLFGHGLTLSTHDYWFSYFFLTFLHLLHVLGGVAFAAWAAWQAKRGAFGPDAAFAGEAGATYWHFVDLIWLLLFPALYLAGGAA